MVAEPISQTICDVIRHWAERDPDKPALVAESQAPLTYGALAQLMDDFRETLNASGFGRGDRVGIVHPGGAEMAATIIGVAGCTTAVPLNPAYTVGEFDIHLRDRGVNVLLVEAGMDTPTRDAAERQGIPVLEVELADDSVVWSLFFTWAGVWGDLSLAGLAAYLSLWWFVWRRICVDALAKFLLLTMFFLGGLFTWMEEPAYVLFVVSLVGLRYQERRTEDARGAMGLTRDTHGSS